MVDAEVTSGDYLDGFLQGTRRALYENGRESITITVSEVSPFIVGLLIALFERAVGLYASLINVNAYHQPGVEAGKKAAAAIIDLQRKALQYLRETNSTNGANVDVIADGIGAKDEIETVFWICEHLAANADHGIRKTQGKSPFSANYKSI